MGLKGYRLWVMGQLDSNVQSPTALCTNAVSTDDTWLTDCHGVALQVCILKGKL
jgi:hypothetical protein